MQNAEFSKTALRTMVAVIEGFSKSNAIITAAFRVLLAWSQTNKKFSVLIFDL